MSKKQKKDKAARSTRQLMGIDEYYRLLHCHPHGQSWCFSSSSPRTSPSCRIPAWAPASMPCSMSSRDMAEIEMLALNSKESFENNKDILPPSESE